MANFKKILAAVLSAAMVVTLAPVGAANVQAAAKASAGTTLKVSASKATVKVGKTKSIKVTISKKQSAALKVTVKSSKKAVAAVPSSVTVKKGKTTASFKITGKKAGKANVTVSFKAGTTTVKKTIKVTVKNSEVNDDDVTVTDGKITLVDADGLQPDGTALLGDTLKLNIPQTIGTISDIIWYVDGNALNSTTTNTTWNTLNTGVGTNAKDPGEYYAVAITTKGTTYKSNTIQVVAKQQAAVIKGFTIVDNYTDYTTLDVKDSDTKAVVTVTLNKKYNGKFYIYKESDNTFSANPTRTVNNNFNEKKTALDITADTNKWYRDAATGETTYMFTAPDALTRGEKYVVVFDQDDISTDTPGSGVANKFETAVEAPYLTAPASIAVTSVADGAKPEVTIYDADKKVLTWFGSKTGVGSDYKDCGIADITVYSNTSKAAEKGTKVCTAGNFKEGVFTATDKNADSSAYWYAVANTKKGIFGKDSVTLTSEATGLAQAAADSINILQNADTPTSADVKFTNLRAAGKVYVIKGKDTTAAATRVGSFNPASVSTYDAVTDVDKGVSSVTIAGVIEKVSTKAAENTYAVVFIPTDIANYSKLAAVNTANVNGTAAASGSNGLKVESAETTYKVVDAASGKTTTNGKKAYALEAYDQFGEKFTPSGTNAFSNGTYKMTASQAMKVGFNDVQIKIDSDGTVLSVIASGTVSDGDKFTIKLKNTTITAKYVADGGKFELS